MPGEQALAVFEFLQTLRESLWTHYGPAVQQAWRQQLRPEPELQQFNPDGPFWLESNSALHARKAGTRDAERQEPRPDWRIPAEMHQRTNADRHRRIQESKIYSLSLIVVHANAAIRLTLKVTSACARSTTTSVAPLQSALVDFVARPPVRAVPAAQAGGKVRPRYPLPAPRISKTLARPPGSASTTAASCRRGKRARESPPPLSIYKVIGSDSERSGITKDHIYPGT